MISTIDHRIIASTVLWMDNLILTKGQAFTNYTGLMYYDANSVLANNFNIYASPFKQWGTDSAISGMVIPTGVFADGVFIPRGTNGLVIDLQKGRALFDTSFSPTVVSGVFAVKDFEIYYTNDPEEKILLETRYIPRSYVMQNLTGLGENDKPFPIIYVKYENNDNEPYAFGGQDKTNIRIRAVVISDDAFKLEAVCSILRDSAQLLIPVLNDDELPLNYLGDYKNGVGFNYTGVAYSGNRQLVYIEKVRVSKFREAANNAVGFGIFGAFCDFEMNIVRFPRLS